MQQIFIDFNTARERLNQARNKAVTAAAQIDPNLTTAANQTNLRKLGAAIMLQVINEVAELINLQSSKGGYELAGHQIAETTVQNIEGLAQDLEHTAQSDSSSTNLPTGAMTGLSPYLNFLYNKYPTARGEDLAESVSAPVLNTDSYQPNENDFDHTLEGVQNQALGWSWLESGKATTDLKTQEGKVRDNFVLNDRTFVSVATDRMSALNIAKLGHVPYKGAVLTSMSNYWLDLAKEIGTKYDIGTHIKEGTQNIDPNITVANKVIPLPVEVVVRRYLAGTAFKRYQKGQAGDQAPENQIFGEYKLAPGIKKNQRLDSIIIDPTTKGKDDKPVTDAQAAALVGAGDWDRIKAFTKEFFTKAETRAAGKGIILADTKFEFGKTLDGRIVLIDESLTPDSSRFWFGGNADGSYYDAYSKGQDPVSFDKDPIRRWANDLLTQGFTEAEIKEMQIPSDLALRTSARYIQIHDLITDKKFQPQNSDLKPVERIKANLQQAGLLQV